jgi:hypothetical protein
VAVLPAVSVKVLEVVAGLGLKMAVTPLGRPEADKVTAPLKPFWGVTVIVLERLVPWIMLRLAGDAESAKFGGLVTVRAIVVVFVKVPAVPEMVTVAVPVVAVLVAVSVKVLVVVAGFVLNDAVTPLGNPEADKVTPPPNPFNGVTVSVLVLLPPCTKVRLLGDADRLKFGGAVTVSAIVVVLIKLPESPVMVTVAIPVVAVELAVSVRVLEVVAGFALNDAVTPLGKPDADKLTPALNPLCGVTVIVLVPLVPCMMLRLVGEAERA